MTDRLHSLVVVLDQDIREDDAELIINAIKMIKHVIAVSGNVADSTSWMAETRAKTEIHQKIFDALK